MSSESMKVPKIREDSATGKKYIVINTKKVWLGKDVTQKEIVKHLLKRKKKRAAKKLKKATKRKAKRKTRKAMKSEVYPPGGISTNAPVARSFIGDPSSKPVVVTVTNPPPSANNGVAEVKKELNEMKALMAPVAMVNGVGFNRQQALLVGKESNKKDRQVQKSELEKQQAQVAAAKAEADTRKAEIRERKAKLKEQISDLKASKRDAEEEFKEEADQEFTEKAKTQKINKKSTTKAGLVQYIAKNSGEKFKNIKGSLLPAAKWIASRSFPESVKHFPRIHKSNQKIKDIEKKIELAKAELETVREEEQQEPAVTIEEVADEPSPVAPIIYQSASAIGPNEAVAARPAIVKNTFNEIDKTLHGGPTRRSATSRPRGELENMSREELDQWHRERFGQTLRRKPAMGEITDEIDRILAFAKPSAAVSSQPVSQHPMMTRRQKAELESAEIRRKASIVDAKYDSEIANVDIFLQSMIDKHVANARAANQTEEDIEAGVRQEEAMADIKKQEIEVDRRAAMNEIYNPPVAAQPFNPASMASLDSMMQSNLEQGPIVGYDPPVQREIIAQPAASYPNLMDDDYEEHPIGSAVDDMFGDGRAKTDEDPGLSTDQINELMKNYRPLYLGCIGRDQIKDLHIKKQSRFGFVMNTDPSTKAGKHWVAIYVDATPAGEHCLDYYNSLADQPTPSIIKSIHQVMLKVDPVINLKFKVNKIADQSDDSANCGYFAAKFLMNRFKGQSFAKASGYKAQYPEGEANIEKWKKQLGIEPFMFFEDGGLHRVKSSKPIVEHRRGRGGRR